MKQFPICKWRALSRMASDTQDFLNIGPTPHDEQCIPAGSDMVNGLLECQVYAEQLERHYGAPPPGTRLVIIESVHDEAGIYHEVGIVYSMTSDEKDTGLDYDELDDSQKEAYDACVYSEQYAFKVEAGIEKWDDISLEQLREAEHPLYTAKIIKMKAA